MDVLDLPVVSDDVSPDDAIEAMREHGRSGVCVRDRTGHLRVVKAIDLILARESGRRSVSDVGGSIVSTVDAAAATRHGLNLRAPRETWEQFEKFADEQNARYVAAGAIARTDPPMPGVAGVVRIVTRHELYADELSAPGDLYCDGAARQHSFPPPSASPGDPCPFGDGGTVHQL